MPLPVTFANLPTGNNPASLLDTEFAAVAAMGTTYCTATGTNTILLTVAPNQPNPTSYVNGQSFSFIAPATTTGPVTVQVGGLAALPLRGGGAALRNGAIPGGTVVDFFISGNGTQADLAIGVPLSGGTINGNLTCLTGTLPGALTVQNISGQSASLQVTTGGPLMILNKTAISGMDNDILGQTNSANRWGIDLGNAINEAGANAGSDFAISRWSDAGGALDNPLTITRATGAVAIKGTSTNDNAAAGNVGEYTFGLATSPGQTLTSGASSTITSVSLTAGDWDVTGEVWFAVGTGGATILSVGTNTAASFAGVGAGSRMLLNATFTASTTNVVPLAPFRFSLAAPATIYLLAMAAFASGTTTAYGRIGARRMR